MDKGTGRALDTQGNEQVEAFFREHYRPLVAFLGRHGRAEQDAEDVAQESFARFLPYTRDPQPVWKATLYRIALNIMTDRRRHARVRQQHQHTLGEDVTTTIAHEPEPDEATAAAQRYEQLRAAVANLPPQCRHVYLLRLMHGLDNVQIASKLGISRRMVEKHIGKAVLRIQEAVGGDGFGDGGRHA